MEPDPPDIPELEMTLADTVFDLRTRAVLNPPKTAVGRRLLALVIEMLAGVEAGTFPDSAIEEFADLYTVAMGPSDEAIGTELAARAEEMFRASEGGEDL